MSKMSKVQKELHAGVRRTAQKLLEVPANERDKFSYEQLAVADLCSHTGLSEAAAQLIFHVTESSAPLGQQKSVSMQNAWVIEILSAAAWIMRDIDPNVAARLSSEATMRLVADTMGVGEVDETETETETEVGG